MLKLLISLIPLAIILFVLGVGFCLGFTAYSIILQRAVRKGEAFVKDRDGVWQPFNPNFPVMYYGTAPDSSRKTDEKAGVYETSEEEISTDVQLLYDGMPVKRLQILQTKRGPGWLTKK